ncbi:MAG TPA: response regulator transcription factor [Anaerolineales bacterium]|jgi:DNA-binding NarL/FixJ family response regulator|nr:response regulator transcription factor [Anaerolineales bacterium]
MPPIRVLLVDDHPIVRSGIRGLLEQASGIVVVGEAESGSQALDLAAQLAPDVMLLDLELPDVSGYVVARQISEKGGATRVLALSAHDDREYIQELLASGASGYLTKEEVPEMIVEAVRGVARGEQGWLSRRVAAQVSAFLQASPASNRDLTAREREVLSGVVAGKTNQEIALGMKISVKTVEKHMESIFRKLEVSSRVEAAVQAVREGWL